MFSILASPTSTARSSSPPCTPVPPPTPDEPHDDHEVRASVRHSVSSTGTHASGDPKPSDTTSEVDRPSDESTESSSPRALDLASTVDASQHMSVQLWNPDQQSLAGLADQWKECRDTFEDFSKGFRDAVERLRHTTRSVARHHARNADQRSGGPPDAIGQ
jgi:hypothetical protein